MTEVSEKGVHRINYVDPTPSMILALTLLLLMVIMV